MSDLCSIELLESALAGSLPPDKEEVLQQHLDQCEACSAAIERLADAMHSVRKQRSC